MAPHGLSVDRRFCAEVLPRVSRTFALNIRLLDGHFGEAVQIAYLLCRAADALEDSWPGSPDSIRARFTAFERALDGDAAAASALAREAVVPGGRRNDLALVSELPRVLRVHAALPDAHREAVRDGVRILAAGMSRYASRAAGRPTGVPYIDTEAELDDYCWIVAGCVGVLLTRLFEATYGSGDARIAVRRLELAPVVGRALQLTNILLDWPTDLRRGRCYVPAAWLMEHGLSAPDLMAGGSPGARALARRLEARAREALAQVPDYIALIPARRVRYRLFCLWPALWAQASLSHALSDPEFPWGPRRPKLPRSELVRSVLRSLVAAHHDVTLRRLYRAYAVSPASP